ncbi:MAG: family 16 glycosylhydrolase [Oscillospiraceae bacterium]|nr:family 16 glycosylhydrolase [Oscillospiraceae bacterium]
MNRKYKLLALSVCSVLTVTSISWQSFAANVGDLNQDGQVNAQDARTLLSFLTGQSRSLNGNADLNNDGKVNAADLTLLKRSILNPGTSGSIKDLGTAPNTSATMYEDFRDGSSQYFIASDGWENGDPFDCGWYKQNTSLDKGYLTLTIDKDYSGKYHYSGAEYRTNDFYHYGYYETSMQAIKNDGVVSSFFTYTGPSDNNPWDEIDIEILGKDTTKVQLNYYTNGQGNHEYMYDLGFDASQGFHRYGFNWQPGYIAWYVDGKEVYRATNNIPSTPGKIMMNTWPGRGVDEWLKPYNGNTPLIAKYEWVTYNKQ